VILAAFAIGSIIFFVGACAWIMWTMRGPNNAAGW